MSIAPSGHLGPHKIIDKLGEGGTVVKNWRAALDKK